NLAWKLAAVVTGRANDDLLDTYNTERHPVAVSVLRTTGRMVGLGTSDKLLVTLPPTRPAPGVAPRALPSNRTGPAVAPPVSPLGIRYPNSPLNRSDGEFGKNTVRPGDRAPDGLLVIAGKEGRLHDLLHGTHHTVLIFAGNTSAATIAERLRARYPDGLRVE